MISQSRSFEVNDDSPAGLDKLVRLDAENVVPGSGRGPDFRALHRLRIDEHTQLSAVTKKRHTAVDSEKFDRLCGRRALLGTPIYDVGQVHHAQRDLNEKAPEDVIC